MINDKKDKIGIYDYSKSHALISDKTLTQIHRYCNFPVNANLTLECYDAMGLYYKEVSTIYRWNIYAPVCTNHRLTARPKKITDHLALMIELLGKMPRKIIIGGLRSKDYFDRHGDLKRI